MLVWGGSRRNGAGRRRGCSDLFLSGRNQPSVDLTQQLRCGNSLLGLTPSEMFVVPDVAFEELG